MDLKDTTNTTYRCKRKQKDSKPIHYIRYEIKIKHTYHTLMAKSELCGLQSASQSANASAR